MTLSNVEHALEDLDNYSASGSFETTLCALDDKEILDKVEQLQRERAETFATMTLIFLSLRKVTPQTELPVKRLEKLLKDLKGIQDRVREIQELINKRLEEL